MQIAREVTTACRLGVEVLLVLLSLTALPVSSCFHLHLKMIIFT